MLVKDIMTADPVCCTRETSLPEVARMMAHNDCGEIPVVENLDNCVPVGVVTDRDIVCRAVAVDRNPAVTRVAEVMSGTVIAVYEDSDVHDCLDKMEEHRIRRVPVLDASGRICGIVAQADIARQVEPREVAEVIRDVSRPNSSA